MIEWSVIEIVCCPCASIIQEEATTSTVTSSESFQTCAAFWKLLGLSYWWGFFLQTLHKLYNKQSRVWPSHITRTKYDYCTRPRNIGVPSNPFDICSILLLYRCGTQLKVHTAQLKSVNQVYLCDKHHPYDTAPVQTMRMQKNCPLSLVWSGDTYAQFKCYKSFLWMWTAWGDVDVDPRCSIFVVIRAGISLSTVCAVERSYVRPKVLSKRSYCIVSLNNWFQRVQTRHSFCVHTGDGLCSKRIIVQWNSNGKSPFKQGSSWICAHHFAFRCKQWLIPYFPSVCV